MQRLFVCGVMISAWALLCGLSTAQEATTGTIEGTATDTGGLTLPGVTVVLSSAQGTKTETTDLNGRFRFPHLPSGAYSLKAMLQGFNSVERPNLDVRLGSRVRVEVVLSPGVSEEIEVIGTAPVVDISTTTSGATISSEMMASIPIGRSFSNTLALAPGVVASGIDAANPSIGGASGLENTYVVDGVNINNTGYGSAGSYSIVFGSLGTGVNFDYIKEVQVKTGGYEPEYGEALGGYINLVTKTGGNQFKGSAFGYLQSSGLEAERVRTNRDNATVDPIDFQSADFGFEVGGPLVQDKAFFFAAFNPTFTTATRRTAKATADELMFSHELQTDREIYNYAANVRWFAHPKHTFSVSSFGDPSVGPMGAQRASALAVADETTRFSEIKYGGNNVIGRWEGELIDDLFIETSVAYHRDKFEEILALQQPSGIDRRGGGVPTRRGGVGFFEDATSSNTQYRVKFSTFPEAMGEHNLRFGVERQHIGYDHTANYSGPAGTIIPVATATGTEIRAATSGYSWDLIDTTDPRFPSGERFRINRIRSNDLTAKTTTHYQAFYVSDSWSPTKWLNLMAGVRYEEETLIGNVAKFTWEDNWAPRAHISVDPTQDGKSKIGFAYGRFFGKVPNDLAVRALSTEVTHLVYFDAADVDLSDPNNPVIPDPSLSPLFFSFGEVPTVVDPEAKLTYQDEFVVNAEREVIPALNVGVSYMHRRLGRTLEDVALVPYSELVTGTTPFGEYFITNPTPAMGFPKPTRKYNAVTLKAERRLDRWQLLGSYTWSQLKGNYEGYFRRDNGQSDPFITSLFDFPYLADPEIFRHIIEDGFLPNDRTHIFNLFGSYAFNELNLNLGASLQVASGVPRTKLGFNDAYGNGGEIPLEPRGASGRGPTTGDIGLHADYAVNLGRGGSKVAFVVNVFNVLNHQKGLDFEQESEVGGTVSPHPSLGLPDCPSCVSNDFGKATQFQSPRQVQFAIRAIY